MALANPEKCIFTNVDLKEKEEELLRLMKKTILEFKKFWIKKTESKNTYYCPIPDSGSKDVINFHGGKIYIRLDGNTYGSVVIWGKQKKYKNEWFPRNLKITFLLNTSKLLIKTDSFIEYSKEGYSIIKDIFYRMNIKTQEDYNFLLRSFEGLLISYI